ncbi:hypothetical protein SDC9_78281 [bioreactor metagenome]|uniref:N-acetyltransferase domain-containing protein n=1 Tax=bioreactor metagenome TaxID=1076179 RepID=A0A644Z0K2_9ZZZZ|nr:GNAT family N-acetyltransferase [Christensenella sp.]
MEFSHARRNDLPELVELFCAATRKMDEQNISQWDEIYPSQQIIARDIELDILVIGRMDGRIAAAFSPEECGESDYEPANWRYPAERIIVLHRLCVHPAFQGKGVARQSMDYLEQCVRERGIPVIRLDAFSQNPVALRLYESRGYQKAGEVLYRKGLFYLYEKQL